ncbi:MAG: hypothetical protein CBC25_04830 [Pelagibacteraceae bacterium TMED65]|nr:MAG: hypothetical protein CBC25_04830 [Pelagibacteraceae bacterium TMED65]|tara:strand:+ start:2406 stop:3092 length:687 start_codon:yes stop_codon:yes gene_type:complete
MIRRLAIIPARGGSKRIKKKNIKNFYNKPLIYYSLRAAKKSNLFTKIHVSTESLLVKKKVEKLGFKIDFMRNKNLSNDTISISRVIKDVLKKYLERQIKFDEIWLIYASNPLINEKILQSGYKKYLKNKKRKSVISVSKFNYPIYWAMKKSKQNLLSPLFKKKSKLSSNKMEDFYCDAGMFVIYQLNFQKNKSKLHYSPFILPWWKTIDIDTFDDFLAAKFLYKNANL